MAGTRVHIGSAQTGAQKGEVRPGEVVVEEFGSVTMRGSTSTPVGGGRDGRTAEPLAAHQLRGDSIVTIEGVEMTVDGAVRGGLMEPSPTGGFVVKGAPKAPTSGSRPEPRAESGERSGVGEEDGPSEVEIAEANKTVGALVADLGEVKVDSLVQALAEARTQGLDYAASHGELVDIARGLGYANPGAAANAIERAERIVEREADRILLRSGVKDTGEFREWCESDPVRLKALAQAASSMAIAGDSGPLLGLAEQYRSKGFPAGDVRLDQLSDDEIEGTQLPSGYSLVRRGQVVMLSGPEVPEMPLSQAVVRGLVVVRTRANG